MSKKLYYQIEIESKHPISEDLFSFLNDFSPLGIWAINERKVNVYFSEDPKEIAEKIKKRERSLYISCKKFEDKNWVMEYQKKLKPIKVGRKFVIVHFSEKENVKDVKCKGREIVKLVPGLAFGTGEHFTTASCIEILETLNPFPNSVLDVGTGSGILSIVSSKLGAKKVFSFDNDFDACKVAKETISLNNEKIFVACSTADAFRKKYDLVIANILFETIVEISEQISQLSSEKGKILLSGIRSEKERELAKLFDNKGFSLLKALRDENWSTLLFSRKTKG